MRFIFAFLSIILFSCTGTQPTVETVSDTTAFSLAGNSDSLNAKEAKPALMFKASGTEPGWTLDFYTDHIKVVLDYGEIEFEMEQAWEDQDSLISGKKYKKTFTIPGQSGEATDFVMEIDPQPCTDDAGDKASHTAKLTFSKKEYIGCGKFVK